MPVAKRRPAVELAADGWEPGRYVEYNGTLLVTEYDGHWFGDVCVYPDGEWVVASRKHVQITRVATEADARAVAEIVVATYGDGLRTMTQQQLFDAAPDWMKAWGKAVRRAAKYLDPTPYLDGAK